MYQWTDRRTDGRTGEERTDRQIISYLSFTCHQQCAKSLVNVHAWSSQCTAGRWRIIFKLSLESAYNWWHFSFQLSEIMEKMHRLHQISLFFTVENTQLSDPPELSFYKRIFLQVGIGPRLSWNSSTLIGTDTIQYSRIVDCCLQVCVVR